MKLRNGKRIGEFYQDDEAINEDIDEPAAQCPLVTKAIRRTQYEPWSFTDMVGLAGRLPDLTEGAGKWLTKFKESTAGQQLALGDIKAIQQQ